MKRVVTLALVVVMLSSIFSGCKNANDQNDDTSVKDETTYNMEYNSETMFTVMGEEVKINDNEKLIMDKALGFGFAFPESWSSLNNSDGVDTMVAIPELYADYLPASAIEKIRSTDFDSLSPEKVEQVYMELYNQSFNFMCLYKTNSNDDLSISKAEDKKDAYENIEKIGTFGDDTYYIAYNSNIPDNEVFSDNDKSDINTMIESIDDIKNSLILFPAVDIAVDSLDGNLNKFTAKDVNGKTVTEDIFADYDLTMVNIWTTWCGFCVEEMPELSELYNKLPEKVNLITIGVDASDDLELAKEILDSANAKFTTLVGNEELNKSLINNVTAYPTTIFVDNKGNIVGEPQLGAPAEEGKIVEGYKALIEERLALIKK